MAATKKIEPVHERLKDCTVERMIADHILRRDAEKILCEAHYELVMPPDHPRKGDQFLMYGNKWAPVTEESYKITSFGPRSYIVRRPTEHLRMMRFFFGG